MHRRAAARRQRRGEPWAALGQFLLAGLATFVLLAVAGIAVLARLGADDALHEARDIALVEARTAQPDIGDPLVDGEPAALAAFDRAVHAKLLSSEIVRVKVWTPQGRIVYSDDRREIGAVFPLDADKQATLRTGAADADISPLTAAENTLERSNGRLLEVYQRLRTPTGRPVLFETYQRFDEAGADRQRLSVAVGPLFVAGLLLLWLLQLPLAWRLTRRVRRAQAEREHLHRRALEASDAERRRIAADLHDGVVQTLAGVTFSLAAVADEVNTLGRPALTHAVHEVAADTRRGIRELRSLLVDIYPPSLREAGLAVALGDLLATLPAHGVTPRLDMPDGLAVAEGAQAVLYRSAQEAVRNVLAHARARTVDVSVRVVGDRAVLQVTDDGVGFVAGWASGTPPRGASGHFGLRLLDDLAAAARGRFTVDSTPGRGTTVRMEVPA